LEKLLTKSRVSILSAFLDSGKVNFSINGLVDFFSIDLNTHIELDNIEKIKICLASDFSSLQILVPYQANSKEIKLTQLGLDLSALKSSLPEILRLMIRAAYFREIGVNLRVCYEKMRMSFGDVQRKVKGFLMDLELEDDPMMLSKLKQFIATGTQTEKINDFFKNLSVKKISQTRDYLSTFIKDLRALLLDTFKAGLSRMSVLLSFLKAAQPTLFDSLDQLVKQAFFVLDSIISKCVAKEIQIRNFCIFLYRSKLKTISPKKVCEYEDENLSSERLDHLQLMNLLESKESLYLKDLLEIIVKTKMSGDFSQKHSPTFAENLTAGFNDKNLDKDFQDLLKEIDINVDLKDLDKIPSFESKSNPSEVTYIL
jgi:hypothetical protein